MDLRTPYLALVSILAVGLIFFPAGCTENQKANSDEGKSANIGAILPQTGPAGTIGGKAKEGLEVAKEILSVQVMYEDSRSTAKGGGNAFQSLLAQNNPDAVISLMSSVAQAVIPMAEDRRMVTMHIASSPDIARGKRYAFRWYITSDMQMKYLVQYLDRESIESDKIAFLHLNDDYGKGSLQAFSGHLDSLGLDKKVLSESYQPDQNNFRSILAKVKDFNPDVIALVGYSNSLGTLVKQIRQLEIDARLIGDDAVSYPQILSTAGTAANGFVFAGLPLENLEENSRFYKTYTEMYDKEPNDFAVFTFGAAKILSTCITQDNNEGSDNLADCLTSNEFETPLGTVQFDKNHNGTVSLVFKTIKSGSVKVLNEEL